ncbi:MAG: GxxExxY protein [Gemmatimonadota bacterium]
MKPDLLHADITQIIIGGFYDVYNQLGYGFLESVYQSALEIELHAAGIAVQRQSDIEVSFRGQCVGKYVADLIVNGQVVVELKAVRTLTPGHEAQLLNLLKATRIEVGLLLNFGPRAEFKRMIMSNSEKVRFSPVGPVADRQSTLLGDP